MLLFRRLFAFLAPYDCLSCGREGSLLCARCLPLALDPPKVRTSPPPLSGLWVGADYSGLLRELLHRYKFEFARDVAATLVGVLDLAAPAFTSDTVVTFVPTATTRVRQRGYDHAEELACLFARHRGLTVRSLLVRHGQLRQVGAARSARRAQTVLTYSLKPGVRLNGVKILLIDDIITTGVTLQAATIVLRAAGARSVDGLVVASKK